MTTKRQRVPVEAYDHEPLHFPWLAALLCAGVLATFAIAAWDLPREAARLPDLAREALTVALPKWHITEPVNEVVYGTRGTDTFGETFLLLAAVVSVLLFTRQPERREGFVGEVLAGHHEQARWDRPEPVDATQRLTRAGEAKEWQIERSRRRETPDHERVGTPAPETSEQLSVVARTAARVAAPVLAIAGVYLVAEGYSPGGGFPAGGVALGVVLLLYAGFGYRSVSGVVSSEGIEIAELLGAVVIIAVEVGGLIAVGSFSANWLPLAPQQTLRSGGILQPFSIGEFIEVGTGLTLVVFALMTMRHDWTADAAKG